MITFSGAVWGRRGGSYLYAIFHRDYVYFGETGDVPTGRWGQHLGTSDSAFFEKYSMADLHDIDEEHDVVFLGLHCEDVDQLEPSKRKIARRAIEEELHRQFLLNKNKLPKTFELLSSPPPPAVRHRFPFKIDQVAVQAFEIILQEYLAWCTSHGNGTAVRRNF